MSDPIMSIRGLRKSFGALVATDDVSLDLYPGEIHALIGPNGAGKSTLIKQIVGEIRPNAGSITFEGQVIDRLDAAARADAFRENDFDIGIGLTERLADCP